MILHNQKMIVWALIIFNFLSVSLQASAVHEIGEEESDSGPVSGVCFLPSEEMPFHIAFENFERDDIGDLGPYLHSIPPWVIERTVMPFFQDKSIPLKRRLLRATRIIYVCYDFTKEAFTAEEINTGFNNQEHESSQRFRISQYILCHHKEKLGQETTEAFFQWLYPRCFDKFSDVNTLHFTCLMPKLVECPNFAIDDTRKKQLLEPPQSHYNFYGKSSIHLGLLGRHDVHLTHKEIEVFLQEFTPDDQHRFIDYYHIVEAAIKHPDYPLEEKYHQWVTFVTTPLQHTQEEQEYPLSFLEEKKRLIVKVLSQFLDLENPGNREMILSFIQDENQSDDLGYSALRGYMQNRTVDFSFDERLDPLKKMPEGELKTLLFIVGSTRLEDLVLSEKEYDLAWSLLRVHIDTLVEKELEIKSTYEDGPFLFENEKDYLTALASVRLLEGSIHDISVNEQKRFCDILSHCKSNELAYKLYRAIQKRCPDVKQEVLDKILSDLA